jgi:hypothetical protein
LHKTTKQTHEQQTRVTHNQQAVKTATIQQQTQQLDTQGKYIEQASQ